jgi:regulator of protease activity HflC (stomatin/prohibitin superfamily)
MKYITIAANQVGLVFKNEALIKILRSGSHWIGFGATCELYNLAEVFSPAGELSVLLQNSELAAMLDVVEVADNEIGLLYKDKHFRQVLNAGKYAFWKGVVQYSVVKDDMNHLQVSDSIDKNLLQKGLLMAYTRAFVLDSHEKGLLIVNGQIERTLGAGIYYFWKNSIPVSLIKTDARQVTADIGGQEVLTRDKAQLRINFTVQYRANDLVKALFENKDYERQLYIQMQMALREIVGKLSFDELMENKEQISAQVMTTAVEKAKDLGVELTGFGVKDIILPGDVKDIMNQVLVAEKRAQANVIMRREETASTRSLLNTAKLMEDNAMLFKLKEMEYVEKIAEKIHTITLSGGGQIVDQLKQLFVK